MRDEGYTSDLTGFNHALRERFLNQTLKVFPANQNHHLRETSVKRAFSLAKETFRVLPVS